MRGLDQRHYQVMRTVQGQYKQYQIYQQPYISLTLYQSQAIENQVSNILVCSRKHNSVLSRRYKEAFPWIMEHTFSGRLYYFRLRMSRSDVSRLSSMNLKYTSSQYFFFFFFFFENVRRMFLFLAPKFICIYMYIICLLSRPVCIFQQLPADT